MENIAEKLKKKMIMGMRMNFKLHGHLAPVMFFVRDGIFDISQIPSQLLKSSESKEMLANIIKLGCAKPNVTVAGIILEANCYKINATKEQTALIESGDLDYKSLATVRKDIIFMQFSTPEKEEVIAYYVNCEKKTIGKRLPINDAGSFSGIFSNFFSIVKN